MSQTQQILTIFIMGFATFLTRSLPFIIFKDEERTPQIIIDISTILPPAIFGMLVVYCLKDVSFTSNTYGIPEAISIIATLLAHKYKKQMLLSIATGTICYMLLLYFFF